MTAAARIIIDEIHGLAADQVDRAIESANRRLDEAAQSLAADTEPTAIHVLRKKADPRIDVPTVNGACVTRWQLADRKTRFNAIDTLFDCSPRRHPVSVPNSRAAKTGRHFASRRRKPRFPRRASMLFM